MDPDSRGSALNSLVVRVWFLSNQKNPGYFSADFLYSRTSVSMAGKHVVLTMRSFTTVHRVQAGSNRDSYSFPHKSGHFELLEQRN